MLESALARETSSEERRVVREESAAERASSSSETLVVREESAAEYAVTMLLSPAIIALASTEAWASAAAMRVSMEVSAAE